MTNPIIESIARELAKHYGYEDISRSAIGNFASEVESVLAAAERLGYRLVDTGKLTQAVFDACNDVQTVGDVMKAVVDHTMRLTEE